MSPTLLWLAIELSLAWTFMRPAALFLQAPGFNGGKLEIKSIPEGANISINGRSIQQLTDVTFVVSPATYKVAVTGGPGHLNCPATPVTVTTGGVAAVTCTASGWQK